MIAGRCDLTLTQGDDGQTVSEQEGSQAHIGSYLWNRTTGEAAAEQRLDTLIIPHSSICILDGQDSKITWFVKHKNALKTAEVSLENAM